MVVDLAAAGDFCTLSPKDVTVSEGQHAVFNCSCDCSLHRTYTMVWIMGDLSGNSRVLRQGSEQNFVQNSGLNVELVKLSDCSEQLRINVSSAVLYNRTAVQCAAYTLLRGSTSHYTPYSVILANTSETSKTIGTTGKHSSF